MELRAPVVVPVLLAGPAVGGAVGGVGPTWTDGESNVQEGRSFPSEQVVTVLVGGLLALGLAGWRR